VTRDDLETLNQYEEAMAPHVRRLKQRAFTDRLRESLLFVPVLLLIAAVAVEQALAAVDDAWDAPESTLDLPPDAAIALLSTIAGATITTAGVVFSLLVVTLQLASAQFSPRVLRTFWRDRYGQVLIGLLLATFAYSVLALSQVETSAERAPTLTLTGALLLAFTSIIAIVGYLNRVTRQQYVGRIMERISEEALGLVKQLPYGPKVGVKVGETTDAPDLTALGPALVVRAPESGWVQQMSRRAVVAAVPAGSVVRLETRVGAFLTAGTPLATIWPRPGRPTAVASALDDAVVLGATRTMQQDVDFGLRQLNDITLRALSAAVNDPTTAIEGILRLGTVMRPLLLADLPSQTPLCAGGTILLTPWDLDHMEYVRHAFDQLRQYAAGHYQVVLALGRTIRMLRAACAQHGDRDDAIAELDRQLDLLLDAAARAGLSPTEVAQVEAAARPRV